MGLGWDYIFGIGLCLVGLRLNKDVWWIVAKERGGG